MYVEYLRTHKKSIKNPRRPLRFAMDQKTHQLKKRARGAGSCQFSLKFERQNSFCCDRRKFRSRRSLTTLASTARYLNRSRYVRSDRASLNMWSSRKIVLLATLLPLLLVSVDALEGNLHLPDYVPVCSRDDPQLGKCIENSINTLRPHIKAGMPEINIIGAEPLRIPTFTIQRGPTNFNIDATISDIVIEGIGDFKITSLSADISKHKFKMSVSFDEMVFSGNYNMSITIFGIPIRGKGIVNGTLPNQHTDMSLKGEKVKRDGVDYLHITGGKMRFIFNEVKLYMSNLFNADPVISRLYQRIINENSKAFMDEISPALQTSTAARFVSASNALTSKLPYDELFPAKTQQP